MKNLGTIDEDKDVTTKEYVDTNFIKAEVVSSNVYVDDEVIAAIEDE